MGLCGNGGVKGKSEKEIQGSRLQSIRALTSSGTRVSNLLLTSLASRVIKALVQLLQDLNPPPDPVQLGYVSGEV